MDFPLNFNEIVEIMKRDDISVKNLNNISYNLIGQRIY